MDVLVCRVREHLRVESGVYPPLGQVRANYERGMRVRKCPEEGRGGASPVQFAGLPRPVLLRINGKLPAMKAIRFASLLVILFATATAQAQTTQPVPLA